MAIANGTCVSFCNQPKAHFGYLRRVTPVCRCLLPFSGGAFWLHRESLRHILAFLGIAPGTVAVNLHGWKEDSMLVKCIATYTHLSSTVYEL